MAKNGQIRFADKNITRDSLLRIYPFYEQRAEAEKTRMELEKRENGDLPLAEPGAMFPGEVMFGTAWYPYSLLPGELWKDLAEIFPHDTKNSLRLPIYVDLFNTSGIFVGHDRGSLSECQSFIRNVMWSFLSGIPVSKLNISVFDCRRSGSITPFLDFRKSCPEVFDGKIYTDREAVSARLKKYSDMIDERIQIRLGTSFSSIIEYNRQHPLQAETIHLIVINDFPSGFSSESADYLLGILENGGRCGIYTLLSHNRDIPCSEYEKLDSRIEEMKACSDVFEFKDGKCWYRDPDGFMKDEVPGDIQSDIHMSKSAAADFIGRYLDRRKASDNSSLPLRGILDDDLFERDSANLLEIPIGSGSGGEHIQLSLGGTGSSHHALIAGGTGGGKSSLFHTIILSAILHYRPDELNLYLMDFKNGTEFKVYENYRIPHIKLLALDAMQEFGESILENLVAEMDTRSTRFKDAGASNLSEYKKATGSPMPRILVVMDEFQILFNESQNRKVARSCAELTKRLVTEGRSFGMHLIMATQSTTIIPELSLSGGVIEQMRIRIGLKCGENDANYLFKDNAGKALDRMKGPVGTAVMTSDYTEKESIGFRVAFCDDDFRVNCLKVIEEEFRSCEYDMQTFEGGRVKKLFERYADSRGDDEGGAGIAVEIGEPIKVAPPLKIVFDKKRRHNVLICGSDECMADNIFNEFMLGALKGGKADVYCMDGDVLVDEDSFMPFYRQYQRPGSRFRLAQDNSDIVKYLNEVYEQFTQRKKRRGDSVIFVAIRNLQYLELCQKLLKGEYVDENEYADTAREAQEGGSDDFFDFLGGSPGTGEGLADKFSRLTSEGTTFGIHFVISCTDYRVVHENMRHSSNDMLTRFTERFVFGLSDSDAGYLIDDVSVAALGDNTVYYSDCLKNTCQIRPYRFPDAGELAAYIDGGMNDEQLPRSDEGIRRERTDGADDADCRPAIERLNALCGDGGSAFPEGHSAEEDFQRQIDTMCSFASMQYSANNYRQAYRWYEKAAQMGDREAMYTLGYMYYSGQGIEEPDYRAAMEWFEKAAQEGYGAAMYHLGRMYHSGQGIGEPDYKAAMEWFHKAAQAGGGYAMYALGNMYDNGQGIEGPDYRAAMEWFEKAAQKGIGEAMYRLGDMCISGQGIEEPDHEAAMEWFEKAADEGIDDAIEALYALGNRCHGSKKAYNRTAMECFYKAARKGHGEAMYNVGFMYRSGDGGLGGPDYKAAMEWFRKAAQGGDSDAMCDLGDMYYDGEGVGKPDYKAAMAWYQKAVEKGNSYAMNRLDAMYQKGQGVETPDYKSLVEWYEKWYEKAIATENVDAMRDPGESYDTWPYPWHASQHYSWHYSITDEYYRVCCPDAEEGYSNAMYRLGCMYRDGQGLEKPDYTAAVEWFHKAAKRGNALAMCSLGQMYRNSQGVSRNLTAAMEWFHKAAQMGNSDAMYHLGWMYKNGDTSLGVSDYTKAMSWFYTAATQTANGKAMSELGNMYYTGQGVGKPDYKEAIEWFEKAAKKGNLPAVYMYRLGHMYRNGQGLEKPDYKAAMEWFRKAAQMGNGNAMSELGSMYYAGQGVGKPDYKEAIEWFEKAAKKGNLPAVYMYRLGHMYRNGQGVGKPDYNAAMEWFEKAAQEGHADAMYSLGRMYKNGDASFGFSDYTEAMRWFRKAAQKGHGDAMFELGNMYYSGQGVGKPDYQEAMEWFEKAAKKGNDSAKKMLR